MKVDAIFQEQANVPVLRRRRRTCVLHLIDLPPRHAHSPLLPTGLGLSSLHHPRPLGAHQSLVRPNDGARPQRVVRAWRRTRTSQSVAVPVRSRLARVERRALWREAQDAPLRDGRVDHRRKWRDVCVAALGGLGAAEADRGRGWEAHCDQEGRVLVDYSRRW